VRSSDSVVNELSQDLKSGNLSAAQQAHKSLQQDFVHGDGRRGCQELKCLRFFASF